MERGQNLVYNIFGIKNGETLSPKIRRPLLEEDTRLVDKINSQLKEFTETLTKGLRKPKAKFISQMLFGIQVARDIKLSEVARSLEEEIRLIKTENRLSRNLADKELCRHINGQILKDAITRLEQDTVIAIDLSSVEKVYARKMDFLAQVWDGVKKEVVSGYWVIEAIAADVYKDWVAPWYGELYSQDADEFKSENELMLKVIRAIRKASKARGIFVIDRGGDRKELINPRLSESMRFVIRLNLNHRIKVKHSRRWASLKEAADRLDCP